mmetsp:Transcript_26039/g.46191  ORF Transcript_26039/g.46191 Transcript_26039/m.46191 type:complete len:343 (-) Transcript_26039:18-1046(-)|eukprot:CAMPEP_0204911518 /NCGR_PEP_ID=MMETSP1397-20131031/9846_1 /ASSEMBLY_ACC=CAM_ASM_000891 /TAXON_ID=49980 /ORGANISM="Climacostomum Climacostomum virens, Strain Stock W-24" /LENGTH=342 /DNA_ID=CAMNT_0052082099 /DNA_START=809 /DNA_END=1837 /DNA_ORIENTATION=-
MVRKVLFLGSDSFSVACLKAVLKATDLVKVICPQHELPVAEFCRENDLQTFVPKVHDIKMKDWDILKLPELTAPNDLIISSSFGHLIPQKLIQQSTYSLNVHPSLLPRYRGASPIQYTLLNRDSITGVTLIALSSTFDSGLIYAQETLQNVDLLDETYESLLPKLANLAGEMLPKAINDITKLAASAKPQDESLLTLAPKIGTEFARLRLDQTAEEVYAKYRALKGYCNSYFYFKEKKVIPLNMRRPTLQELERLAIYTSAKPRSLWLLYPGIGKKLHKKLLTTTGTSVYMRLIDSWIVLEDLQFESKPKSKTAMKEFISANFGEIEYILQKFDTANSPEFC